MLLRKCFLQRVFFSKATSKLCWNFADSIFSSISFHFSIYIFFLLSQRKALVARLFRSHVLPTHLQSDSRSRPHKVEKSNNNNDRAKAFSVIRFFPNRMNKYQWKSIYVSLSAWSKATPFHLRFNLLVSLF